MAPSRTACHAIPMKERRATVRWATMALDARAIPDRIRDPESKQTIVEIAAGYDRLATRAAELVRAHARVHGGRRREDVATRDNARPVAEQLNAQQEQQRIRNARAATRSQTTASRSRT